MAVAPKSELFWVRLHRKVNFYAFAPKSELLTFWKTMKEGKNTGRKKILKKVPDDIVPRDPDSWLLQPIAVSMMRYDYDLIQSRAVVAVMREMQAAIKEVIYHHAEPGQQLSLFDSDDFLKKFGTDEIDTEKEVVLKLALKNFGCDKRKYDLLKSSLKQLVSIPVEIPVKSLDDENYYKVDNLCSAYIPRESYSKYVYLKFRKEVAVRLISNERGTHKYLDSVILQAKSKYTQRMYLFISAWQNQGATCVRTVQWIRKWLRLESSHKRWDMFYSRVLKKAEEELHAMAMDGRSDLYFSTRKIYESGPEVGEPGKLQFVIYKVSGIDGEEERELRVRKESIKSFCHERFGIRGTDMKAILDAVTADNASEVMEYLEELEKREQKAVKSNKIDRLNRHAFACIMNYIRERGEDLKTLVGSEGAAGVVRADPKPDALPCTEVEEDRLSGEEHAMWDNFLSCLRERIDEQEFATWFANGEMRLAGVEDGRVKVRVPNRVYAEIIGERFRGELSDVFGHAFPGFKDIVYLPDR